MARDVDQSSDSGVVAELTALQRLLEAELPAHVPIERVTEQALQRARLAFATAAVSEEDERLALHVFAAELLAAVRLELAADVATARQIVDKFDRRIGVPRALLARELLRAPGLLAVHPMVAISSELALLTVLAPLEEASLWTSDSLHDARCIAHAGKSPQEQSIPEFALSLLKSGRPRADGELVGLRIERRHQPAALIGRGEPAGHDLIRAVMAEAMPMMAALLDSNDLLTRRGESELAATEAKERQITRLSLDLHDGPLQDVAALARDIRMFRHQLAGVLAGHDHEPLLVGRVDDLEAQLVAIDADLRRVSVSLQSPFLTHRDLVRALHESAGAFAMSTGIQPRLELLGDLECVSDSQQMALLAIIREALNNVRDHSTAKEVKIAVTVDASSVRAEVTDDGSGFDVESTLLRAARDGHVGLVGMQERVRLLDGHSHIQSRPGGPTTISVSMPIWRPEG